MKTLIKALAAATILLLAAWLWILRRQVPMRQAPFPQVASKTSRIEWSLGPLKLSLVKDHDAWKVSEAAEGPLWAADDDHVKTLLSALENLQLEDVISERSDRTEEFELGVQAVHIRLLDAASKPIGEGFFGKQSSDHTHLYFQASAKGPIWLARGVYRAELGAADVSSWRDVSLVPLKEPDIRRVTITIGKTVTDIQQTSPTWKVNEKPADSDRVNTLIGALAHLRASGFVNPGTHPFALDSAQITIEGGTRVMLRFGPHDVKGKRYTVSSDANPGVATLDEGKATAVLIKPADLLPVQKK